MYFCQPTKELSGEAFSVIKEIIEDYESRGVVEVYNNVFGERLLNPNIINFNGVGKDSCESFCYVAGLWNPQCGNDHKLHFEYSKTNRYPYDDCVMDVMLVLSHFDNTIYLASDGIYEWKPAFERIEKKYGFELSDQKDMIYGVEDFDSWEEGEDPNENRKLKYFDGRISTLPAIEYETPRFKATKHLPLEERMRIINEETKKIVGPDYEWESWIENGKIEIKLTKTPTNNEDPAKKYEFVRAFEAVAYAYTNVWNGY